MLCGDEPSANAEAGGPSLQERFLAMRQRKMQAAARVKAAESAKERTPEERAVLRQKFVAQVRSYIGTPYNTAKNGEGAPLYLDCCGLVRRALLDLKEDLGFEVGPWNQSYLHDTLPTAVEADALQPGDLIFWRAEMDNPERKKQIQYAPRATASDLLP